MDSCEQNTPADSTGQDTLTRAIRELAPGTHLLNALQLIIDAHSLVTVTDRSGRIIYANDRFCDVSKYSRNELIGQTHRIVRSDYHPPSFYEEIWAAISSGGTWQGDIQNRAKDGSNYWVQSTISPIFDAQNRIVGYGSVRTDVTANRQLVSDLQDSEKNALATLTSAIDVIDSSLLIVDASGNIVATNQAYSEMYPESAEEERPGNHFIQLVKMQRPDFLDEDLAGFTREVLTKDTTEQHVLEDGRTVKIQRRIAPGGGFVSLHTDVSDIVRQTELLEAQAATMDLMKAIAVDANESTDTGSAYATCLERICGYTRWEVGHVYLPRDDDTGHCLPAGIWYCSRDDMFTQFRKTTQSTPFPRGVGLPGRVFESGQPAWVRDVTEDANFPRCEAARQSGLVGGAAFPVKILDKVVAVLEFYSSQPIQANPQLEEILSHVCSQMGRVAERERAEKTFKSRVALELRRRDRELIEQNKRFDAALKNMTQGLCMFDAEKRLIVSNDRYAQIYDLPRDVMKPGITLGQILEYRIANGIFAGDNPEEYIKERMAWVESGEFSNKVQQLSDGRSIAITHQPMSGGGWLTTHEDITDRVASELALHESEVRFRTLVETTNVVPWEFDPATMRFTYVGPQAVEMFGYPVEDWYAEEFFTRLIHPDDREAAISFCMAETAECEDHDFEYRAVTADGRILWIRDVVSVIVENGVAKGLRGVLIDISDRVVANEALKRSEQRFKDIVEVSSDWIWECDENLRFTYLSERITQVTGVPRERILGKTRHELGMDGDADWESHLADLAARRPFREFSYAVKGTNGHTQHWVISGRPVFDADGTFKGYCGTGADRTADVHDQAELIRHRDHLQDLVYEATAELKHRADELRASLAKEKELNELQRQFVSMASHEFRTPLAIIDSAAQRLLRRAEKLTPADTVKRVEKIRGAVGRMTQLMESTLDAARIEEGKINIVIRDCDLRYVVLEVLMSEIELSPKHKITCDLKELPDLVQGDSGAFAQIFSNLVSNAVKYSPDASDIHIKGWCDDEFAVVEVRDRGLGIDEQDLPNMFQRFFRAQTSAGIAGTGIGLNLVKTLVELHEGKITVESRKSEGSQFKVFLPICGPLSAGDSENQAA